MAIHALSRVLAGESCLLADLAPAIAVSGPVFFLRLIQLEAASPGISASSESAAPTGRVVEIVGKAVPKKLLGPTGAARGP